MSLKETDPVLFEDLMKRMKRIEGQARGIQRLLDEGAACDAVVNQLSAVKEALNRVGVKMVACQFSQAMAAEIKSGGTGKDASAEMTDVFLKFS